jgi:hypothetical protein
VLGDIYDSIGVEILLWKLQNNSLLTGVLAGDADFFDTSKNFGTLAGDATFYDSSDNSGGIVESDAIFRDTSFNGGIVLGNV